MYRAPVREVRFVVQELLGARELRRTVQRQGRQLKALQGLRPRTRRR
jgi:hypothetical protein